MPHAEPETATLGFTGQEPPIGASGPIFLPREIAANRFRVVRLLGQGGMAQVFEAEDLELGQNVAIKVIRPELAASRRAQELLRREVLLARRVTHPNVCRIFDVFHHPGLTAEPATAAAAADHRRPGPPAMVLVMELVAGETLAQRLTAGGPLSPAEALPVVQQLAEALDAAHRSAVVHGDFKSGNVILEPAAAAPRAVVTDFGLAQHSSMAAGCAGGTTAYMAPEQIWQREVTPASDIYALGVVIYEMVVGHRPLPEHGGAGRAAVLASRLAADPDLRRLPPGWPEVLASCLAPSPRDRPACARDVARSLAAAMPGAAALPAARIRRPLLARAGVAALLLVCLGLVAPSRAGVERSPGAAMAAPAGSATASFRDAAPAAAARLAIAVGGLADETPRLGASWLGAALGHLILSEIGTGEQVEAFQETGAPAGGRREDRAGIPPATGQARGSLHADLLAAGSFALSRPAGEAAASAIRIELWVIRLPEGRVLASLAESGRLSNVAAVVARLGARLRRALGVAEPSPEDRLAAQARRPASLEAEGFFAQGLALLRRGEPAAASAALGRALAADPAFSLSHAAQAQACAALGYHERAKQEALQATRPSRRLPEQQKLEIAAISRRANDDLAGAAGLYRALWSFAPHHAEYGFQLVEAQLAAGEASGALETLRVIRSRGVEAAQAPLVYLLEARARFAISDLAAALAAALAAEDQAKRGGNASVLAAAQLVEADARAEDGDADNAAKALAAARDFYRRSGFRGGEAEVGERLAALAARAGRSVEAEALNRQALSVFASEGSTRGSARVLAAMGRARLGRDLGQARALLAQALAELRRLGDRAGAAHVLDDLSLVAADSGDPGEAEKLVEESVSLESEIGDRRGLVRALTNLGGYESPRGEIHAARQHVEEALRISEELGFKTGKAFGHANLGDLLFMEGNLHAAGPELLQAVRLAREANWPYVERIALLGLGAVLLQEGKLGLAEDALGLSLALPRDGSATGDPATLWELARVQLREGRFRDAEGSLRRYLKVPPGSDTNPRLLAVFAVSQAGQGKLAEARQAVARATRFAAGEQEAELNLLLASAAARVALAGKEPAVAARRLEEALQRFSASPYPDLLFEARVLLDRARLEEGRTAAACGDLRSLAAQTHRQRYELVAQEADGLLASAPAGCRPVAGGHG